MDCDNNNVIDVTDSPSDDANATNHRSSAADDEFELDDKALAQLEISDQTNTTSKRSTTKKTEKSKLTQQKPFNKGNRINGKSRKFCGLGYGAKRLNGCDISDLVPAQVSDSHSYNNNDKAIIKKVEKLDIFIRPRLHVHENRNAPSMIKAFIRVLRQIDPTLVLLPLNSKDNSLNHSLHNEENLPDTEDAMSCWIAKVRYNIHKKLCFSARISITMDIQEFKSHAFPWCKIHQHWITFDEIKAEENFTPGWLCGLHHKNVDIDVLKKWICDQDGGDEYHDLIKIYPRKIWQNVPDTTEKRMSDVLAIDASAAHSDSILKFLFSIKWSGIYDTTRFIPMKINEVFTVRDMLRAIDVQNAHRNNGFCKSIVIPNHNKIYSMADGTNITFIDWALQCTIRDVNVFRNVYATDDNYVKFVYPREKHSEVRTIISNLFEAVEKKFSLDVAKNLFTSKKDFRMSLNIKEAEIEYLQATAASLRSNPQSTDVDTTYRPRDSTVVPTFGPVKVLETISYSQVAQSDTTNSNVNEKRIQELEKQLKNVTAQQNPNNSSSANTSVTSELQAVYDLINKNKTLADKKNQVRRSTSKRF